MDHGGCYALAQLLSMESVDLLSVLALLKVLVGIKDTLLISQKCTDLDYTEPVVHMWIRQCLANSVSPLPPFS